MQHIRQFENHSKNVLYIPPPPRPFPSRARASAYNGLVRQGKPWTDDLVLQIIKEAGPSGASMKVRIRSAVFSEICRKSANTYLDL